MKTVIRNFSQLFFQILLLCLVGAPQFANAEDWFQFDFSLRMSNRFTVKQNFLNLEGSLSTGGGTAGQWLGIESPLNLRFNKNELGYSLFLGAGAELQFGEPVSLHLNMDSGELKFKPLFAYEPKPDCTNDSADPRCRVVYSNGRAMVDEAKKTWFLREAFLEVGVGLDDWFTLRAGKILVSTGNGFIMDNYALGGMLVADLDLGFEFPLKITLEGLLPNGEFTTEGKHSPYVYLDVAYLLSFFEEIGLFVAWYHDGDNNLAEILRAVLGEILGQVRPTLYGLVNQATITSSGNVFWIGLRGNKIFNRSSLTATAIVEFGSFDFSVRALDVTKTGSPSCLGGMLELGFHYDLTDDFTLGTFFLFLSGETYTKSDLAAGAARGKYNSFISVYPYITLTNLFFSGGMNENFSSRSFSASGVNGRGVLMPGITAGWDITEDLSLRFVSALLFSQGAHMVSEGHFYGWENDLNFEWNLTKYLRISIEADHLWTGNFFDFNKPLEDPANQHLASEPSMWKILLGVDLFY